MFSEHTTFRFNPAFELVVFDRLEPGLRARLAALNRDPSFYGILLRAGADTEHVAPDTVRAVDRESALLLLTLRTPGPIPAYARRLLGAGAAHTITSLVLDGVLEIEDGGVFRSGPGVVQGAALREYDDSASDADMQGVVPRLSIAALRHGATLPMMDVPALGRRLYRYNSLPLTPSTNVPASAATDLIRLGANTSAVATALDRTWTCAASGPDGSWVSWSAHARWDTTDATRGTCKLYVSPALAATREAFAAVVAAATAHGALAFKAGSGPYGLLRPDKLVMYFRHRDQLHSAAAVLTDALAGAPAQGVPFTAAITSDGMVSWAADPPPHAGLVGWSGGESWRGWLTTQLAAALIAARGDHGSVDQQPMDRTGIVRFALRRAAALRIDPRTWIPADTLWQPATG